MGTPKTIELLNGILGIGPHDEKAAAAGSAIKPGHLIELTSADEVQEHSTAAQNAAKLFALPNLSNGGDIDTAYLVGEGVRYGAYSSGQEIYARVAAGATAITLTSVLESAGDGTLRVQAVSAATAQTARDSVIAYPLEAVDNSGGGTEVFIKVRIA